MATTSSQQRSRSTRRRPADGAARSRARANGRPADTAARAQQRTREAAAGATGTLHQVADKAKAPALVGGAALAAIAGGVALARNGRRSKGSSLPLIGKKRRGLHLPHIELPHVSMPQLPDRSDGDTAGALRATAKALGAAAVEVGKAGYRAGELASEVRRVREQAARTGD